MNYPPQFMNMHKLSALKIAPNFITLSPKRQHAIKALLSPPKNLAVYEYTRWCCCSYDWGS